MPDAQGTTTASVVFGQLLPAGQSVHSEAPAALKLPAGHADWDVPSDAHSKPAGHCTQEDAPALA